MLFLDATLPAGQRVHDSIGPLRESLQPWLRQEYRTDCIPFYGVWHSPAGRATGRAKLGRAAKRKKAMPAVIDSDGEEEMDTSSGRECSGSSEAEEESAEEEFRRKEARRKKRRRGGQQQGRPAAALDEVGWEAMRATLTAFKAEHGHCSVTGGSRHPADPKLGTWVAQQRKCKKRPATRTCGSRRSGWPSWRRSGSSGAHPILPSPMRRARRRCWPSWLHSRPRTGTAGFPPSTRPTRSYAGGSATSESARRGPPPEPVDHGGAGGQAGGARVRVEPR